MPAAMQNLVAHDIDPRDALRYRMLDLNARIHFHEVELLLLIDQKFKRAGIPVADRLDRPNHLLAHLLREAAAS